MTMLQPEVQYRHHYHRLKGEIPFEFFDRQSLSRAVYLFTFVLFASLAPLLQYRITRIIQRPLTEILLPGLLHLHDESASVTATAGQVKHRFPVLFRLTQMISLNKCHILDFNIFQHPVQEGYQYILVLLASENTLEHEVIQKVCILAASTLLFRLFLINKIPHIFFLQSSGALSVYSKRIRLCFKNGLTGHSMADFPAEICSIFIKNPTNCSTKRRGTRFSRLLRSLRMTIR